MGPLDFTDWRNKLKLSQDGMAKHLGVARETVNRWEKGKSPIPHKYDDLAAKAAAPSGPARITPATHPHLYEPAHKAGRWAPNALHPRRVLALDYESYPDVTDAILTDPTYLKALESVRGLERAKLEWQNKKAARDFYPDAVGNETVAQYLARTKLFS
jgi:transcriptional regulator with XRE-family HTH domain